MACCPPKEGLFHVKRASKKTKQQHKQQEWEEEASPKEKKKNHKKEKKEEKRQRTNTRTPKTEWRTSKANIEFGQVREQKGAISSQQPRRRQGNKKEPKHQQQGSKTTATRIRNNNRNNKTQKDNKNHHNRVTITAIKITAGTRVRISHNTPRKRRDKHQRRIMQEDRTPTPERSGEVSWGGCILKV